MTGEAVPRPAPPDRPVSAEEQLAAIAELPLARQVEAFDAFHRELENRLRASET